MGYSFRIKIILVILILGGVSVFIHVKPKTDQNITIIDLAEYLRNIDGWEYAQDIYLPDNIVKALDLDDFLHRIYKSADIYISLYIGYYHSNKKIGAAHSPLVCFPGQGWDYTYKKNLSVQAGKDTLNIAKLLISKGEEKQLVLYWFQAYDKTTSSTFTQKIDLFLSRLVQQKEHNAFVRIMLPLNESMDEEKAMQTSIEFIRSFYPQFKKYMTTS